MRAQESIRTDVLIIGSGAVGVAASIDAAEAGADVTVLERESHLGGAAAISGGGCCLVGTPLQQQNGIEDNPDLAFQDWVRWGRGAADEEWARFYIEHTLHDLYEWAEDRGVRWVAVRQNEGNSVPRWHQPEGWGLGLWQALHNTAIEKGADKWIVSTAAREFIIDQGRVVGVRAENVNTGQVREFLAKAVVMGSGGFASNVEMVYEYRPDLKKHRIFEGSHIGATGHGHRMVETVGGVLTHMGELWFYVYSTPDYRNPKRGLVIRGIPDAIWVNAQGRRFHNEALSGGASGAPAVLAQEPAECWAILDSTMIDRIAITDPQYYQEGSTRTDPEKVRTLVEESPDIKSADTLGELARQMGVPPDVFVESVNRSNGFIERGLERDPDFGRPLTGRRMIEQPPFHALRFVPLARKTFGGVKTNLRCQALDKHYAPIPGLYAAGELAGMAGGHINGKAGLEGTMLGPSLFSGRVAGAWAAHEAGFGPGFVGKPNRS